MKEMSNSLQHIVQPAFNHLDNNHPLDKEQSEQLKDFNDKSSEFFNFIIQILKARDKEGFAELTFRRDEMINLANEIMRNRIKILKKTQKGVKVSVTYMEILSETKTLFLTVVHLVKAHMYLFDSLNSGGKKEETKTLD